MKNTNLLSHSGFSLVETILALGLMSSVAISTMYLTSTQNKSTKGLVVRDELNRSASTVGTMIIDPVACTLNFLNKPVGASFENLKDSSNLPILSVGSTYPGTQYRVSAITLTSLDGVSKRGTVAVDFQKLDTSMRSATTRKIFYIFMEGTTSVTKCLDPLDLTSEMALELSCLDADPKALGVCPDIYKNLLQDVKAQFCNNSSFLQMDPATGKCVPLDAGRFCAPNFVRGFDGAGNFSCVSPPPPSNPAVQLCTSWGPWTPSNSSYCGNQTFTQSQTCQSGSSGTRTRTATGTGSSKDCCSSWGPWLPATDASQVCSGQTVAQTSSCQESGNTSQRTNSVSGTKNCDECKDTTWTPDEGEICTSNSIGQTSNCGNKRTVSGTKNCGKSSCTPTKWTPEPGTTCSTETVTQTSDCGTTQTVPGTKNCVTCEDKTWTPDSSTECSNTTVNQTSNCGKTRSVPGGKNCATCIDTTWTPDLSQTCKDVRVSQTSNCNQTREVNGTKDCSESKGCLVKHPAQFSEDGRICGTCHDGETPLAEGEEITFFGGIFYGAKDGRVQTLCNRSNSYTIRCDATRGLENVSATCREDQNSSD